MAAAAAAANDTSSPWYLFSMDGFWAFKKHNSADNNTEMGVMRNNGGVVVNRRTATKWSGSVDGVRDSEGIASLKKLLGFTICLVFFMAVCALVFSLLERPHEQQAMIRWQGEASAVKEQFNLSDNDLLELIERLEGIKKYGLPRRSKWSFYNAFWFTMTITTTIGFGHITPDTSAGRLFCIVCGLIGIPLNALVLKHVGNKIRLWVTRAIKVLEYKCLGRKRCRSAGIKCACVLFALMILVIVLGGCLDLIFDGWTIQDGIYFNFIALSTIGFGDIYPSVSHPSKLDTLGLQETEKLLIASLIMVVYLTLGLAVVSSVVVSILTAMDDCDKTKRRLAVWRRRQVLKQNQAPGYHDSWKYGVVQANDMEERYCKQFGFESYSVD